MARRHWHPKHDRPEHWKFGHWVENLAPGTPDPPAPGVPAPARTGGLIFYADTFEVEVQDKYSPKNRRRRW